MTLSPFEFLALFVNRFNVGLPDILCFFTVLCVLVDVLCSGVPVSPLRWIRHAS